MTFSQQAWAPAVRCPSCGAAVRLFLSENLLICHACGRAIRRSGCAWDLRAEAQSPGTDTFSRQWQLWADGKLGRTPLIYGQTAAERLSKLLSMVGLSEPDLGNLRRLDVGCGHGLLLREPQR